LGRASAGLRPVALRRLVAERRERLRAVSGAFDGAARASVAQRRQRLDALERLRLSLGYRATLARGYAVVRDDAGALLTEARAARKAKRLEIEFQDGRIGANVPATGGGRAGKGRNGGGDPGQGSLF